MLLVLLVLLHHPVEQFYVNLTLPQVMQHAEEDKLKIASDPSDGTEPKILLKPFKWKLLLLKIIKIP